MHLKRLPPFGCAMKGKADPYTGAHLDDLHMAVDRTRTALKPWLGAARVGMGRFFGVLTQDILFSRTFGSSLFFCS